MDFHYNTIINTESRWNVLSSLLDERESWKFVAEVLNVQIDEMESSRDLLFQWSIDSYSSISKLQSVLKTLHLVNAVSTIDSWITEELLKYNFKEDDPITFYETGTSYWLKDLQKEALPFFEKAASMNYAPSFLMLCLCYSQNRTKDALDRYQYYLQKSISQKSWFEEQTARNENTTAQVNMGMYYELVEKDLEQAFYWRMKAAERGNPVAQNRIGCSLVEGEGVAKNAEEGVTWFKKAAEQGHLEACINLACCYRSGEETVQDIIQAKLWFLRAANAGHPEAQFHLGTVFESESNWTQAIYWFEQAARQQHTEAITSLGACYADGVKDLDMAIYWLKKVSYGNKRIQHWIGYLYETAGRGSDITKAYHWYLKAANSGNEPSQVQVGLFCKAGTVAQPNATEAFEWFLKAANQGYPEGQYHVGLCYEQGFGVQQDCLAAIPWFQKAADAGHIDAMFKIAFFHIEGIGFKKQPSKAIPWLKKVVEQDPSFGNGEPSLILGKLCSEYENYVHNRGSAYWYHKAAIQDNIEAQYLLGESYYYGNGAKQDFERAVFWFQHVIDQNSTLNGNYKVAAEYSLARCYEHGTGVPQNLQMALDLLKRHKHDGIWNTKSEKEVARIKQVNKIEKCKKEEHQEKAPAQERRAVVVVRRTRKN